MQRHLPTALATLPLYRRDGDAALSPALLAGAGRRASSFDAPPGQQACLLVLTNRAEDAGAILASTTASLKPRTSVAVVLATDADMDAYMRGCGVSAGHARAFALLRFTPLMDADWAFGVAAAPPSAPASAGAGFGAVASAGAGGDASSGDSVEIVGVVLTDWLVWQWAGCFVVCSFDADTGANDGFNALFTCFQKYAMSSTTYPHGTRGIVGYNFAEVPAAGSQAAARASYLIVGSGGVRVSWCAGLFACTPRALPVAVYSRIMATLRIAHAAPCATSSDCLHCFTAAVRACPGPQGKLAAERPAMASKFDGEYGSDEWLLGRMVQQAGVSGVPCVVTCVPIGDPRINQAAADGAAAFVPNPYAGLRRI